MFLSCELHALMRRGILVLDAPSLRSEGAREAPGPGTGILSSEEKNSHDICTGIATNTEHPESIKCCPGCAVTGTLRGNAQPRSHRESSPSVSSDGEHTHCVPASHVLTQEE